MWRGKKWVIVVVLAVVVVAGSVGGVALAADDGDEGESPPVGDGALLDRVCEIYEENTGTTIDPEALQDAVAQAQRELLEEAMQNRLEKLVEQGEITHAQADEYLEWWQARPEVAAGFGCRVHGRFRGMGGPPGWCGLAAPRE